MKLGVNIDHIAVLRNARQINDPNPLDALSVTKFAGAEQITIHLREDRRHINDTDAKNIIQHAQLPVNLECSIDADIIRIVTELKPYRATLVPEKREEVTTEGGLDIETHYATIAKVVEQLHAADIEVSLFIDPDTKTIELAKKLNVAMVELHTGAFANIYAMRHANLGRSHFSIKSLEDLSPKELATAEDRSIEQLILAAQKADKLGLRVAAGHGLNYQNVYRMHEVPHLEELNIGQSIVARSVFSGLESAIREMKEAIR